MFVIYNFSRLRRLYWCVWETSLTSQATNDNITLRTANNTPSLPRGKGSSLQEADGDVPLDGVAFSRLDWL